MIQIFKTSQDEKDIDKDNFFNLKLSRNFSRFDLRKFSQRVCWAVTVVTSGERTVSR